MSITKPIPEKLRLEMEQDPFYKRCCVTGAPRTAYEKIEWHHNLMWEGERVNEKWCILPISKRVHDRARDTEVKEVLDWIMLQRADEAAVDRYNLRERREYLNNKYANEKNIPIL